MSEARRPACYRRSESPECLRFERPSLAHSDGYSGKAWSVHAAPSQNLHRRGSVGSGYQPGGGRIGPVAASGRCGLRSPIPMPSRTTPPIPLGKPAASHARARLRHARNSASWPGVGSASKPTRYLIGVSHRTANRSTRALPGQNSAIAASTSARQLLVTSKRSGHGDRLS
jgi:hypothetical protein